MSTKQNSTNLPRGVYVFSFAYLNVLMFVSVGVCATGTRAAGVGSAGKGRGGAQTFPLELACL